MTVLFLIRSLEVGGAERQMVALANGLAGRGHAVHVAVLYSGGPLETDLSGVNLHHLGKRGRFDLIGPLWRLVRLCRGLRPDAAYGFLGTANLMLALLGPLLRVPVAWGVRATWMDLSRYSRLHRLHFRLERLLSRLPRRIVYNSESGRAFAESVGFPRERGLVIENGIDTDRFRPDPEAGQTLRREWGIAEHEFLVGNLSRLDPMKDHPTFLKAAALAARERPDLRFVCVGAGPEPYAAELRALAYRLGLTDRLAWAGLRLDVVRVHNALDACCLSSAFGEGFPNVLGEAQACGTPCVATDVGDSARLVGPTGRIAPPGDPEALARSLLDLAEAAHGQREEYRQRTRQELGDFSLGRMVERTEDMLHNLTAPGRRHPVRNWIAGTILSLLVAWIASALFLNSLFLMEPDPATGLYTAAPGSIYRHRSEGWGRTVFGRHGISGIEDAAAHVEPKILFWGDSLVEGLQVDDADKMAQAFTRLAEQRGPAVLGVGLGASGERVADYYFKMPVYERLLPNVAAHCIVIADLEDVLPDNRADCHGSFLSEPAFSLVESQCEPSGLAREWGPLLARLELQGAFAIYRQARDLRLRFAPGPVVPDPAPAASITAKPGPAWDFLLTRLRQRTDLPLVMVYVPHAPNMDQNSMVLRSPRAELVRSFAAACAGHGIDFVDLSDAFQEYYRTELRFPRGFANTPPGNGHLNAAGHRMVAQAVLDHLTSHALLPR